MRSHWLLILPICLCTLAAETGVPLFQRSFEDGEAPKGAEQRDATDGVAGKYVRYGDVAYPPRLPLAKELAGDYTLAVWLRAKEWLEETPSGFGKRVPPTLMALYDAEDFTPIVFRVCQRRLQLAVNHKGQWGAASGWHELPEGKWIHAAAVRRGGEIVFYVNGVREITVSLHRCVQPLVAVRVGNVASRTFFGDLDEATVWDRPLADAEVAALVPAAKRAEMATFDSHSRRLPDPAYPGRELRVAKAASSPLVAGLSAHSLALPWFGAGRNDLLSWGLNFNGHPAIHRELSPGKYAPGTPATELAAGAKLPHPPYYRLPRSDGGFDLLSTGKGTPHGDQLLRHRNTGKPGAPTFTAMDPILCDGTGFRAAYHAYLTAVQDVDRDGTVDLLMVRGHKGAPYSPDSPKGFWGGEVLPNSGKGKGYSVNGQWLGYEGRYIVVWARGERDDKSRLTFGKPLMIYQGETEFPLQWKGYSAPRAVWVTIAGKSWLVLAGNMDQMLAVPATVEGDAIRCGPARPFLADGAQLRYVYHPHAIDVRDLDQDGQPELLISGNPGSLSILRGKQIGSFREERAMQLGGALAMQTLTVPCRVDWDGDGIQDLVAGDASGWLDFWPGTADPMVYRAPIHMRVDGQPVHAQAGYDGSIQGPNESRWGYLNPTVGDWDGDGRPDLITCDIRADMLLFPRTADPAALQAPKPFTHQGKKLRVAWRQRPAILPAKHGAAGDRPCLVHMDWDGVLCLGIPERKGSTEIVEQRQFLYDDGKPVKLDGPAGLWGRAKFALTDWDGDGIWDVVFGTNRSDHQFFSEECTRRESTPFLLRNTGTNQRPVFARPVPIKLGDEYLGFGVHNAAVWPTDMDGDSRDDLIIGAEDGRIYRFLRQELRP
jgi:hypothetical protein